VSGVLDEDEALRLLGDGEVSAATGWDVVPPTVLREGPFGPGMCQLWIETEPAAAAELVDLRPPGPASEGWLPIVEAVVGDGERVILAHRDDERLRRIAVLDAVVNNADRKGGHLLPDARGHVYGVDHGVCFATEDKLRTLLWGWAGAAIPAELAEVLARLAADLDSGRESSLAARLGALLTAGELAVTRERVRLLLRSGRHPAPNGSWPAVPWPPF
jgi:uncharacterized repeat protein (TIGR03843 family)